MAGVGCLGGGRADESTVANTNSSGLRSGAHKHFNESGPTKHLERSTTKELLILKSLACRYTRPKIRNSALRKSNPRPPAWGHCPLLPSCACVKKRERERNLRFHKCQNKCQNNSENLINDRAHNFMTSTDYMHEY